MSGPSKDKCVSLARTLVYLSYVHDGSRSHLNMPVLTNWEVRSRAEIGMFRWYGTFVHFKHVTNVYQGHLKMSVLTKLEMPSRRHIAGDGHRQ